VCRFLVSLLVVLPVAALVAPAPVLAANLVVHNPADTNTGTVCTTTGDNCTLRDAIAVANANPGSTITFDTTIFNGGSPQTVTLGSTLVIDHDMTITGPGATVLMLDGGSTSAATGVKVFAVQQSTPGTAVNVTISNMTIQNGNAQSGTGGGAIDNEGGNLTVATVTFNTNTVTSPNSLGGGAIYSKPVSSAGGSLTVQGSGTGTSIFTSNTAAGNNEGGAIVNDGGTLTVTDTAFHSNATAGTSNGGAILNQGNSTTATITRGDFNANQSSGTGGAIYSSGPLAIVSSTFIGNHATFSGGAIENSGAMWVTNSTFYQNSGASGAGGAIDTNGTGLLTLKNNTISGNITSTQGGGGLAGPAAASPNPTLMINTIVAGNSSQGSDPDVGATFAAGSTNNLIGNGTGGNLTNGVTNNQVGNGATPIAALLANPAFFGVLQWKHRGDR